MANNPNSFTAPSSASPTVYPVLPVLTPEMFGAKHNGVTNDYTAISNTLSAAALIGAIVQFSGGAAYKCNSTITIDVGTTKVCGPAILDFSSMTTGNAITVTSSLADNNVQMATNTNHPISDLLLRGPDPRTTTVTAVLSSAKTYGALPLCTD